MAIADLRIHTVVSRKGDQVLSGEVKSERREWNGLEELLEIISESNVADLEIVAVLRPDISHIAVDIEVIVLSIRESREGVGAAFSGPELLDEYVGLVLEVGAREVAVALQYLLAECAGSRD